VVGHLDDKDHQNSREMGIHVELVDSSGLRSRLVLDLDYGVKSSGEEFP
jgi:hypothetical protein